MSLARQLLVDLAAELRADPSLAAELRDLLGVAAPKPAPTALYMRVRQYAEHCSLSERTIWNLIKRGMPTIGNARGRRVDVARADAWRKGQQVQVDDAVEKAARAAAAQTARRASR